MRMRTQELNDRFRTTGVGNGSIMLTASVEANRVSFMKQALDAVRTFDNLTPDNDAWGEHDFGAFTIDDQKLFWRELPVG